jgi:arsenate reductase (glutaredoxin)
MPLPEHSVRNEAPLVFAILQQRTLAKDGGSMAGKIIFYQKPTCSTCRKAKALLLEQGVSFESRDLDKDRLTEKELDELIGRRDYKQFLNTRNEVYRERNMKEKPPSRAEAIRLMSEEPNLIRRPLLVYGAQIIFGFDEEAYRKL